jgi:hypothetical protein
MTQTAKLLGKVGAVWGFTGAFCLISFAVWRLTPLAIEAMTQPLTGLHWSLLVLNVLFMTYSEGYKGFQLAFAPRVAARSLYLAEHPTLARVIFAPLFVIGYFHATRRRLITTYLLTSMIIVLVLLVHELAQPWRGIVDAGVVAGLIWGLASMLYFMLQALTVEHYRYSPEVS